MPLKKVIKDKLLKAIMGKDTVPRSLLDLHDYFRIYGPINFEFHKEDDHIVAVSSNFKQGSIITSGSDQSDLDQNIKDAILTAFGVPSSYAKEASVSSTREKKEEYALV